jgi:hypothetical protein
MGWLVVIGAKPLNTHVSRAGKGWLVAGDLLYTTGVVFCISKRIPFGQVPIRQSGAIRGTVKDRAPRKCWLARVLDFGAAFPDGSRAQNAICDNCDVLSSEAITGLKSGASLFSLGSEPILLT